MELITLPQILEPLASVAGIVTRSIYKLSKVKAANCSVPIEVTTLIGQLYIVQAILDQLFNAPNPQDFERSSRSQQLAVQFDHALQAFVPLVFDLRSRVDQSNFEEQAGLNTRKSMLLWDKREISEYLILFEKQANTLNLLLQVTQCHSWFEQMQLIMTEQNQSILRLAQECMLSSTTQTAQKSVRFETPCTTKSDLDFDFGFDFGFDALPSIPRTNDKAQKSYGRHSTEAPKDSDDTVTSKRPKHEEHKTRKIGNAATSKNFAHANQENFDFSQPHLYSTNQIDILAGIRPSLSLHSKSSTLSKEATSKGKIKGNPPSLNLLRDAVNTSSRRCASSHLDSRQQNYFQKRSIKVDHTDLKAQPSPRARKTLLLGISESGKTTFFKGCHFLDRKDAVIQKELITYKHIIFANLLHGTKVVLNIIDDFQIQLGTPGNERYVQTILSQNSSPEVEILSKEVKEAISALWEDTGFQEAFRNSREYQLYDNFDWFASAVPRISSPDYKPSIDDVMRVQIRTTGVATTDLVSNQSSLTLVDVGGTRVERRKWKHVYRDASSVFFIVDADAYDKSLEEDFNANRMQEQLLLFDVIVNSPCFASIDFVLVFSKVDLLTGHLKMAHPQRYMPDFEPGETERAPSVNEYLTYLEGKFLRLVKDAHRRAGIRILKFNLVDIKLYTHEIL